MTATASIDLSTRERYERDGYVVLEQALTPDEVARLNAELVAMVRGELGPIDGSPVGPGATEAEALAATLCVHFPHKLSPLFADAMRHPAVVPVLVDLLSPDVKCMQSMAFVKSEGKPGQAWHQDEQFIPTRDRSLVAAWIALDDATVQNGCLWAIPGSHRPGVLYPQQDQQDDRFDCTKEAYAFPYDDDDAVALEVRAGDVVLFNGYLLHRSLPNYGGHGLRRALVNHYMNAASLLPWHHLPGVNLGMTDHRDIVMVAGSDPYAWNPLADLSPVHVRRDGQGGCAPVED
jgi:ectoine hydroxylase-related dioxygenase (phytanoyl-CoA dioxygenase family)